MMFKIYKESFAIAQVIDMINENAINLNPRYQRTGGIWKKKDNQLLIDSIFNGIELPKFYFHLFPHDDDNYNYQYSVIDGKQRILAIKSFLSNKYPVSADFYFWENDEKPNIAGLCYKDIELQYPLIAGDFLRFRLDVSVIDSDDINRIDTMFIRINKGVCVNSAEKRNAHGGKLIDIIADACTKCAFFKDTLTIRDERKSYQELYLKIYILEQEGKIVTLKEEFINSVLEHHKDCLDNEDEIVKKISVTLNRIAEIFGKKEPLFRKHNVILLYWFLKDKLDDGEKIAMFIRRFETIRLKNSECLSDASNYQRFNELSRQGIYNGPNMEERLGILEKSYKQWKSNKMIDG